MDNLLLGFAHATTAVNLAWCFLGVVLGTLVGVLPGLGPMATISLLLPLTYGLGDPTASIIMLAGVYYGSQYGGSITAILLRLPGEPSSTVTVLDGYAMTQKGRGGAALTITALASFVGGTVATLFISLLAVPLSEIAFAFGPAEYANLMVLGVLACVALTQGSWIRGLVMVALGAWLGLVGTDVNTGQTRFTGGIIYLVDGIPFAVLAIGIFGLGEILYYIYDHKSGVSKAASVSSLYPTSSEFRQAIMPGSRGTVIGTLLGLLPGGGATLSSFLSYALEKRISRTPEQFGKGAVAGLASPEAANNASSQSQFLPTLMLGLPVTPVMSLMLAVLIMNGIQPGPNVINTNPELFWGLIVSMWIGNAILLVLNIPLVRVWVWFLRIPKPVLYPAIMIISMWGVYSLNHSWFDMVLLLVFAGMGLVLRMFDFEPAPMALAFIVAPMLEEYSRRALTVSQGDWLIFVNSPLSIGLMATTLIVLILSRIRQS